jgi:hypothetical protein
MNMNISSFDDFLDVARSLVEPQRLLFVFAGAELPEGASAIQREAFEHNEGGELTPLMCVDKSVNELSDFNALVSEAACSGPAWSIVFAAALQGHNGAVPTNTDIDASLQRIVDSIKSGQLHSTLPFDRQGYPVRFA